MSKRRRRLREDAQPADHGNGQSDRYDEPKLAVSGDAFAQFDSWIDMQLDTLVNRWIHVAAPAASTVRRVIPKDTRRTSGA
jgi:hypothetical protein